MALKAGTVGINPKYVDKYGKPKGSGGTVDAYTKSETDTLLADKVDTSQLTANSKTFNFAYDATSQKYGYKLDGTGEFIPFEQAGGPGWIKPAELTMEGVTFNQNRAELIRGGYAVIDGMCYVDICVNILSSSSASAIGLPYPAEGYTSGLKLACRQMTDADDDSYVSNHDSVTLSPESTYQRILFGSNSVGTKLHAWGVYPVAE